MKAALLIDFGSTYTKLRAVDVERATILGAGQGPSTVGTDITVGMRAALADLERHIGVLPAFAYRLACSSAAGGLRMVTVGLVRELTAEAARQAALGAGARLVGTFAYRLTAADVSRIEELAPDILLLAGGTDGGNSEVILHNADALGRSRLACPIVLAGNRSAMDQCRERLAGRTVIVTENVMPEFNVLNIEPARGAIREVFIDRIVHAKGIDRAQAMFDRVLMPTPAAVMEGARLLADGCDGSAGLGDAAGRGSRWRDHRRALGRLGRAQPGGRDCAGPARAASEAHGRGRPRHAPQHRGHRRSGGRRCHRRGKRARGGARAGR